MAVLAAAAEVVVVVVVVGVGGRGGSGGGDGVNLRVPSEFRTKNIETSSHAPLCLSKSLLCVCARSLC